VVNLVGVLDARFLLETDMRNDGGTKIAGEPTERYKLISHRLIRHR
jgi:hypothetical protein